MGVQPAWSKNKLTLEILLIYRANAQVGPGPSERTSEISLRSIKSEVLPDEPSQLRLSYQEGDTEYKFCELRPLQLATKQNASCAVTMHRPVRRIRLHGEYYDKAAHISTQTQTKEMSMLTDSKAQIVYMEMYPTPENLEPTVIASRQPSLDLVIQTARKEKPGLDFTRIGPKITKFSSKKRILQPLKEDFYKEELFWTGSRFCGEYRGRQFYKGRYDHPTGMKNWKYVHLSIFSTTKEYK